MIPQIQVGDFLVVDKFSYGLKNPVGKSTWFETREPKKGEMVAFIPEHTICSSPIENAYPEKNLIALRSISGNVTAKLVLPWALLL